MIRARNSALLGKLSLSLVDLTTDVREKFVVRGTILRLVLKETVYEHQSMRSILSARKNTLVCVLVSASKQFHE